MEGWKYIEELALDYMIGFHQVNWMLSLNVLAIHLRRLTTMLSLENNMLLYRLSILQQPTQLEVFGLRFATLETDVIKSLLLRRCNTLKT